MVESSQGKPVVVTDIGQTLADGGYHYFRAHRGEYDFKNPASLAVVYNDFAPLPHAREGLKSLIDTHIFGGYYTVRPPELQQQATDWLQIHGFPDATKIRVSKTPYEKLEQVTNDFLAPNQENIPPAILLIDDNLEQLTKAAALLVDERPEVRDATKRIIIVGFGGKNDPQQGELYLLTGLRTATLTSWEDQNVSALLNDLNTLYASNQ